ncbi:MAG: hypothetical protein ACYTEZ_19720 [Planctomycetota bacterium]|jgi:hypothetical protein
MRATGVAVTFVLALGLVPACSGTQRDPGPERYRAWCSYENKFLGPWDEDRQKVEAQRKEHERRWPTHLTRTQVD